MKTNKIYIKLITDWSVHSKEDLFKKMAQHAMENKIINDFDSLNKDLFQRELLGSTLIHEKIALPHIQSKNIMKSAIIYVKLDNPVQNWDSHKTYVYGILFILVKESESSDVLKKIKTVISSLSNSDVINLLLNNEDEAIYQFIKETKNETS